MAAPPGRGPAVARELSLAVVGLDFPNERGRGGEGGGNRRFELALMRPGDPVELRREPKNPADPRAVGVWSERGVRVGYLTAERCGWIGGLLARGEEVAAVLQEVGRTAAVVRARFGGGEPTLPAARAAGEGGGPEVESFDDGRPGAEPFDDGRPGAEPFDDGWPG